MISKQQATLSESARKPFSCVSLSKMVRHVRTQLSHCLRVNVWKSMWAQVLELCSSSGFVTSGLVDYEHVISFSDPIYN